MSELENTKRIYGNLQILLSSGNFPGSMAGALAEAQQHVEKMNDNLAKAIKDAEEGGKNGTGDRDATDTGRVAGGGVPDQGRPRRKRKSKRAGQPVADS